MSDFRLHQHKKDRNSDPLPNPANRIPWWWPMLISAAGIGIAMFEAYNNYQNWPVSGLAGSMILGGLPAWAVDSWIRGRQTPMGGGE